MTTEKTRKTGRGLSWPVVLLIIVLVLLVIAGGVYVARAMGYEEKFLPGTSINGVDVSGLTVDGAEQALDDNLTNYTLTLVERENVTETITAEDISMALDLGDSVEQLLEAQNSWLWPLYALGQRSNEATLETAFVYDSDALSAAIAALTCLDSATAVQPTDAYISGYDSEAGGVVIQAETQGTLVDEDALTAAVVAAVDAMEAELDLDAAGCYVAPTVTSDDPDLVLEAETLNGYLGVTITYEMGEDTVVLDGSTLIDWLTYDGDGTATLDSDAVAAFVKNLASTYNTIFSNRTFTTTYGQTITVEGGDYGWWMDQNSEVEELTQQILDQESGTREPVWYSEAAILGNGATGDYGDTYVEINLTAQHLYYYKDGALVVESDFVSGKNDATPTGTYGILYCERYATLNGENYSSPVSYWMPFYNGVGLHDASWRTSFGGTIYKTSGSHGCINLPIKVAKKIYENMSAGTAVIVYKLSGTESSSTTTQSNEDIASAIVDALEEITAEGEITSSNYNKMSKRIQWVEAAYDDLSSSAKKLVSNYDLLEDAVEALKEYDSTH
ncbi:MAG: L,D-transpeptidase/peptidoglycan binding protein [Clostridiales bacterium]|nr:L,D-transpeptidase/peptidoglycan binding protein [Clostridiales bacterium]